jgi:hypothetical protein
MNRPRERMDRANLDVFITYRVGARRAGRMTA